MPETWTPDWGLPPEPAGDDEDDVIAYYDREAGAAKWLDLAEWQRESWRREYRACCPQESDRIDQRQPRWYHRLRLFNRKGN